MDKYAPKEIWDTYLERFDHGKTGSKTFRVDLIESAPLGRYPFLLIAGVKYKSTVADGFPEGNDFQLLYKLGDELLDLIESHTEAIMVGSFLYNFERLEYFYINHADNIISKIEDFYKTNYPNRQFFVTIKEDKNWKYYKEFLYPKHEMLTLLKEQAASRRALDIVQ